MTYKLEPGLGRIVSPVRVVFPDGHREEYASGEEVADAVFDRHYVVKNIRAEEDTVEIILSEHTVPSVSWIGEEQTFF